MNICMYRIVPGESVSDYAVHKQEGVFKLSQKSLVYSMCYFVSKTHGSVFFFFISTICHEGRLKKNKKFSDGN